MAAGMKRPLKIARPSVIRSQVQYRPVVIAAITTTNAHAHRNHRPNAEKTQAGANADEFRDERQKIPQDQIAHREESPESSETVEDQFGVPPMRDGAQPHSHLLHDKTHQEREHDKRE